MNTFKSECEYLLEKLRDTCEQVDFVINIAEECLYSEFFKNKKSIENNIFYLDAIKFSIKEMIEMFNNIDCENGQNFDNTVSFFLKEQENDVYVDLCDNIVSIFEQNIDE